MRKTSPRDRVSRLRLERLEEKLPLSASVPEIASGSDVTSVLGVGELPLTQRLAVPGFEASQLKVTQQLQRLSHAIDQQMTTLPAGEVVLTSSMQAGLTTSFPEARVLESGEISVYISGEVSPKLIADLEALNVRMEAAFPDHRLVSAWVPHAMVADVAGIPGVDSLRLPSAGVTRSGSAQSSGDAILRADETRTRLGFDGAGVRVGVISNGVDNLSLVQGGLDPDLPAINVNPALPGFGDEGTAMLEIIHDLAPAADLYFSSGSATSATFVQSVNWLVAQGVDVIVDDIGYFDEHFFSDSFIAQAVQNAIANGVTYMSAAGNESLNHYQGGSDFATGFHDFDAGAGVDQLLDLYLVPPGGTVDVFLQWSDPWGASSNDYDLLLFDSGLTILDSSSNIQSGSQNPFEQISWTNTTSSPVQVGAVVSRFGTPADREFELFAFGDWSGASSLIDGDSTTADSVFGHPAVPEVISTVAIAGNDPGNDDIRSFSSQGPSTVFTNFSTQAKSVRSSVDGAGIDGVETRIGQLGFFPNPFVGTSAAAPHAAAIAALMLEADSTLTPSQVSSVLASTAIDILAPGYDNTSGAGRFDALGAVYSVFTPATADLLSSSDTGASTTDNVTNDDTPTISVAAPAGSYVRIYADGVQIQAAQFGPTEALRNITLPSLTDDTYDITVRVAEDSSVPFANLSEESAPLTITIDTVAPSVSVPDLSASSDSGTSDTDNITNDNTPTFFGTAQMNTAIDLLVGGVMRASGFTDAFGNWSLTSSSLGNGTQNLAVEARMEDLAGNVSLSSPLNVTIDTVAPSVSVPDLDTDSDSGTDCFDEITNITTPVFNGSAEDGVSVELLVDGVGRGSAIADSSGSWSITSNTTLGDDNWDIQARATDTAGNIATSGVLPITVDTIPPAFVGVPDLLASSDTGASDSDDITKVAAPDFTGTVSTDAAAVAVLADGMGLASDGNVSDGVWDISTFPVNSIPDGEASVVAKASDAAGNSIFSAPLIITVDTLAPRVKNLLVKTTQPANHVHDFDAVISNASGPGVQLVTVAVASPDILEVDFDEDVLVTQTDLTLTTLSLVGTSAATSAPPSVGGSTFTPSPGSANWEFNSAFGIAQYLVTISDNVIDTAGNALDGEWVNPASINATSSGVISSFPSGDASAGGDFAFVFTNALMPITNLNGTGNVIDNGELNALLGGWGMTGNATFDDGDFSGDGNVDNADLNMILNNWGITLEKLRIADTNDDGHVFVTQADYDEAFANLGLSSGAGREDGDVDGDGDVDQEDIDMINWYLGLSHDVEFRYAV